VVAISGSEKTKSGAYPESFAEFQRWIGAIGLGGLDVLKPLAYFGLAEPTFLKANKSLTI